MDKKSAFEEFLKALKIALNNCTIYFSEHPLFIQSLNNLKIKIESVLNFDNPLTVIAASHSLACAGMQFEKQNLYEDLAQFLHQCKIKSLSFSQGVSTEELSVFITQIALPAAEIFKQGGISHILKQKNVTRIVIEELDYSALLEAQGAQHKEIWPHIIRNALQQKDDSSIDKIADTFGKIVSKYSPRDIIENENLQDNLLKFFEYLKGKDKTRFEKCSKELAVFMLNSKDTYDGKKIEKILPLFAGTNENEILEGLWDKMAVDESFDVMRLELFTTLLLRNQHEKLAFFVAEKLKNDQRVNQKIAKKIKDLFLSSNDPVVSSIYQKALSSLLTGQPIQAGLLFDRKTALANYRLTLLNLLAQETRKKPLQQICDKIMLEFNDAIKATDTVYITNLFRALEEKQRNIPQAGQLLDDILNRLAKIVEETLLKQEAAVDLNLFGQLLAKSSFDANYYLDKIFIDGQLNSNILYLFFKFFHKGIELFYAKLKIMHKNVAFLQKIITALKGIQLPQAFDILKYIFSFSSRILKIEILKSMGNFDMYNTDFLLTVLKSKDIFLRKCAVEILSKRSSVQEELCRTLFAMPNLIGLKNKVLLQNLEIADELGLKCGEKYLAKLAGQKMFWNISVHQRASQILKKWHDRTS